MTVPAPSLSLAYCASRWRQERLQRNYQTAKAGLEERRDAAAARLHYFKLSPLVRQALELDVVVRELDRQLAELDDDARALGIIEVPGT